MVEASSREEPGFVIVVSLDVKVLAMVMISREWNRGGWKNLEEERWVCEKGKKSYAGVKKVFTLIPYCKFIDKD